MTKKRIDRNLMLDDWLSNCHYEETKSWFQSPTRVKVCEPLDWRDLVPAVLDYASIILQLVLVYLFGKLSYSIFGCLVNKPVKSTRRANFNEDPTLISENRMNRQVLGNITSTQKPAYYMTSTPKKVNESSTLSGDSSSCHIYTADEICSRLDNLLESLK